MGAVKLFSSVLWQNAPGITSTEQTWITFAGAYIGSIIGAVGTVVVMFRTLREERNRQMEDRKYADYLYLRSIMEDFILSVDSAVTGAIINDMYELLEFDFSIPNIKQYKNDMSNERLQYGRLRRAMNQSILPLSGKVKDELDEFVAKLWAWEFAFDEFTTKVIRGGINVEEHLSDWAEHRAKYTDAIYKEMVKAVRELDYYKDEHNNPIPYSFVKWFVGDVNAGETFRSTLGGKVSKTPFTLVYINALDDYQKSYWEIRFNISKQAELFLADLRKNIDVC